MWLSGSGGSCALSLLEAGMGCMFPVPAVLGGDEMYPLQEAVIQRGAISWYARMILGRGQLTLQPSPILNVRVTGGGSSGLPWEL